MELGVGHLRVARSGLIAGLGRGVQPVDVNVEAQLLRPEQASRGEEAFTNQRRRPWRTHLWGPRTPKGQKSLER